MWWRGPGAARRCTHRLRGSARARSAPRRRRAVRRTARARRYVVDLISHAPNGHVGLVPERAPALFRRGVRTRWTSVRSKRPPLEQPDAPGRARPATCRIVGLPRSLPHGERGDRPRRRASTTAGVPRRRGVAGPRALVLEGEAGIGKSTLWLESSSSPASEGCASSPAARRGGADLRSSRASAISSRVPRTTSCWRSRRRGGARSRSRSCSRRRRSARSPRLGVAVRSALELLVE